MKKVDLKAVRPYGDTLNDGKVQVSFTLPISYSEEAVVAAEVLATQMGLHDPQVAHKEEIGEEFTFFVVYGTCRAAVDVTSIKVEKVETEVMEKDEVNKYIKENFDRPLTIVGACIGSDAHTVGIDAIMNLKGYNHHKVLESYSEINAHNLGAQVSPERLVKKAIELKADAILVSQIVTQKDIHIQNLTKLIDILEAEGVRDQFIIAIGGPRIDHKFAQEFGFDAGFGPGTYAENVASYVAQELKSRKDDVNEESWVSTG